MDTGLFEDYHYQNSADREDGISEQEWDKRREDWESILDESSSFGSLPSCSAFREKVFLRGTRFP